MFKYTFEIYIPKNFKPGKSIGRVRIPFMNDGRKEYTTFDMLYFPDPVNDKMALEFYDERYDIYGGPVNIGIGQFEYSLFTTIDINDDNADDIMVITVSEQLI